MGLKLYFGGCGVYQQFTVAETEDEAKKKIGEKIGVYLPVDVALIDDIDGYKIIAVSDTPVVATDETLRHCKKCDFTCESQGELLKHYREAHPKEA